MKKILVILLVFVFVVPSVAAAGPPPQGGTPPPPGDVPPVGQNDLDDLPALDLANLPVPEGAKFAMDLSTEKRDKAHELVRSLTDEQRASIGQLLADNPLPGLDNVAGPGQAGQSAEELQQGAEALKASLFAMNRWRDTISSRLAGILTPEQYALYQDSLLPAPVQMDEPRSQTDCYYAYHYGYYGYIHAYYFYIYAYYTYSSCSDPYAYLVYELAYNSYLYSYYGYIYSYYAYVYFYNATYAYYAGYFNRHAEGFSYYGYNMAYILDTWCQSDYSYYAYLYGSYAYYYIDIADSYAWSCYYDVPTAGNKYAVIVGIADFQYINDLNYTDDDANDFYNMLISRGGFSSANINRMIDSQATKANIQSAITSWLDSREGADDLVVIFYSAHGDYGPEVSPYDENDSYDEYLCTYNSLTYSYSNDIRDDELDSWLDNLESNKVVVIVDTCFSGGLIASAAVGEGATVRHYHKPGQEAPGMAAPGQGPSAAGVQSGDGFARDVNQAGRIVMTASAETEVSYETSAFQNGVFTKYLLDGLNSSSADTNSNSWVSTEEAYTYLDPRVRSYTSGWPTQNPQLYDGISGQVDLTQPSSSASVGLGLPVGVSEPPSGQEQPGDRGGLPLGQSVDLSALPVPEEMAGTGFAMSLDAQKAQLGSELVSSLTAEQKARVRALLDSNRSAALESAVAKLTQAAQSKEPGQDIEAMEAAVAEVKRWQEAMSAGMAEILTPEQYALYQDSLLPAPVQMEGMESRSQTDCYYAYHYGYYANYYAYYYYVYAYYTYASSCSDPYVYDNYVFGYDSYLYSYYGYVYSYYAYAYYPDSTYQFYACYFTRHAEGFTYWGYQFAYMTYTWCGGTDSYYAYLDGYYAYNYTDIADSYAWDCYTGSSSASSDQGSQPPGGASPSEPRPSVSWGNPEYSLTVDRDTVKAGECVILNWHAKYVREAYLNGEGLVGESGGRKDCLYTDKDYVLRVVLNDGSTRDVIRTVTVE